MEEEVTNSSLSEISQQILINAKRMQGLNNSSPRPSLYMPTSIISPIQVDMTLNKLFAAASEHVRGNFDDLMVPFLCVASDMRNHQAVVLTDGDLGSSIRASMAIPIAFNPVKRDSSLLYDGGIYDNYPWRPLLERHSPDIMIGSICTSGNTKLTEQSSLIDQIFVITTQKSEYDMPEGNLTIKRDVPAGMLDFASGEWIIDLGYYDTLFQMDSIKGAIVERRDSLYYSRRREEFTKDIPQLVFEAYEINGLTTEQNLYVRDFLQTSNRHHGQRSLREMTFDELQENLYRTLSTDDFSTEYPIIKLNAETERYKFFINLESKPLMKLSVGGYLSSTAFNQLILSFNYKQIKRVAQSFYSDLYLGTLSTSAIIGGRTDFFISRPLFLDYFYAYSNVNREYSNLGDVTQVTNCESVKTRDNYFSLAAGVPLSRRSLLTLRVNAGWSHYYYDTPTIYDDSTVDPSMLYDRTRLRFAASKLEYQRSTLDRLSYPTSGSKLSVSTIAAVGEEVNYQSSSSRTTASDPSDHHWLGARVRYDKYFTPPGDSWFSLGVNIDAVYTTLRQFGNPTATMLMMPSYQPVAQSQMIFMPDFSGDKYVGAGIIPVFNIAPNVLLRTGAYAMLRDNYDVEGVDPGVIGSEQLHYILEATTVYHSQLGALSLSLTKYDLQDWNNMYITFGFGIPIFAPKGIFY